MNSDWNNFKDVKPISPPSQISDRLQEIVYHDLNPSWFKIFSKISLIHFFVGAFVLAVCPQFGFKLFGEGLGLLSVFMKLGHYGCEVACGFFFLGSSFLVVSLILTRDEFRVMRSKAILFYPALAFLSLGFFVMFNPKILTFYALLWLIGTLLGAITVTELMALVLKRKAFAN